MWIKSTKSNGNGGNNCVECFHPSFAKSSRSNPSGNCVEVSKGSEHILVRDTKDPDGGTLSFTRDEWIAFIAGVKDGEFDI